MLIGKSVASHLRTDGYEVRLLGKDIDTVDEIEEPGGAERRYRVNGMIARSVGIVAIASGFIVGMYGLDHPESIGYQTALGLLATGMLAQGYALYCSVRRARELNSSHHK